ncbi:MAG: alpha/beta hydrolase [Acidimicrobiia bacterium]
MRRTLAHVAVCLVVAALGFAAPGVAPADEVGDVVEMSSSHRVVFTVENPQERAERSIVGYRYDPPCQASTVVLLQHGLSYHKEAWDTPGYSVARPLAAAGYAVVAIDRLGYGESKLENGNNVSFEAYGHMTDQIVTQLRSEFDHVVLGGHSAGAGVTEFAQGLFGSADAIMALGWHHRPSDQIGKDFFTGDTPRSLQDDYEYFLGTPEHRAWMFYEPDADPAVVEADNAAANLTPSGEIQTIGKQPSRTMAGNVKVPVFIQLSEKDRLFEPQYADFHAAEFVSSPSVTVDIVPVAGHTFMLAPQGPAGTSRMVDWLRSRPEAPACS